MRMPRRHDVCAASVSDLPFDARVWKEARSLVEAGYSVALIGCRYEIDRVKRRREHGVNVVEIPFGTRMGKVSIRQRVKTVIALSLEILRMPSPVYHAHNVEVALPCLIASRIRRARLVYDAHELHTEPAGGGILVRAGGWLNRMLERLLMHTADEVITTNRSRANVLERAYDWSGIAVLGNVPHRVDELRPIDPGYPDGERVLLYQGHVSAEGRAFRETIEALADLDDLHFAILGFAREGRLDMIRRWAREYGVADRVHLYPPRPFCELVGTAALATVGLVPIYPDNLNHYLGDTNKIFEYLMAGLPVVASDLPEIRRVAMQGRPRVGELFDPHSPASIARSVRTVLADDDVYRARRAEARRLALEVFNWSYEERKLVALYERLEAPLAGEAARKLDLDTL